MVVLNDQADGFSLEFHAANINLLKTDHGSDSAIKWSERERLEGVLLG